MSAHRRGRGRRGARAGAGTRPAAIAPRGRLAGLAVGLILAGAFYLLLIDTTDLPELYAGAAVAVLGALAFEVGREQRVVAASLSARGLLRAWRVLVRVPGDVWQLSLAALEQLRPGSRSGSTLRAVPFAHGRAGSPRDSTRRALAESLGSLAPNTIVIGIDPERDLILAHQLRRRGGAEAIDVLGLG